MKENLDKFLAALTTLLNEYKKANGYTYFKEYLVKAKEGNKFIRVYKFEAPNLGGGVGNQSILCFIDKVTGDILKPATYKAPAKGIRGNVNSAQNGMEAITPQGFVIYFK